MAMYRANYSEREKKAFAALLKKLRLDKGWKQSELARAASKHLPDGTEMGRNMISSYEAARSIPEEQNLRAIEKALVVPHGILLRDHSTKPGEAPPQDKPTRDVQMSMMENGQMRLMINVELDHKTGWAILEMLKE